MLEGLKARSEDHLSTHPDEIKLGHVGILTYYARLLR
jgi:hypothetical protein